ncbi:serine peptidase [Lentzea sp. NPDC054927]
MKPVLAVHGIGNLKDGKEPETAAVELAAPWQARLEEGVLSAGLKIDPPPVVVAYYAHLLTDSESQGSPQGNLDRLTASEEAVVREWLLSAGVPAPDDQQGWITAPLRQWIHWLAQRRGTTFDVLARIAVAMAREVTCYLTRPERRRLAREAVASAIERHQPAVVVAHSLGSVVTFEALHAYPETQVDLLVTVGSPLGLPVAIFDALEPEPKNGKGARPPGVRRWVNLADPGDVVAVPQRLGDRFPVDLHDTCVIGKIDFHTLGAYLAHPLTAATIAQDRCAS